MRFRVISRATCNACHTIRMFDDSQVWADSKEGADEAFRRRHGLCPDCLSVGVTAALEFQPLLDIDPVR